jgi:Domain of unknown function (DUF4406)
VKLYLAGPMTGLPDFNFPAFDLAEESLSRSGYTIFNPAQMDRDVGFDPKSAVVSEAFLRDALRRDLSAICECDAIAMLPGWEKSGGATVEWTLAKHLGLKIIYLQSVPDQGTLPMWHKSSDTLPATETDVLVSFVMDGSPVYAVANMNAAGYWESDDDKIHGLRCAESDPEIYWMMIPPIR